MVENNNWYTHFSTFEEDRGYSSPVIAQGFDPRFNRSREEPYFSRCLLLSRLDEIPTFHIADMGEDLWPRGRVVENRNCDNFPCLHFMLDGEGTLNGTPVEANQAFVTDPAIPYSMASDGASPFHYFWFRIRIDMDFFRRSGLFTFGEDGVGRFDFSACREDVVRLCRKGLSLSEERHGPELLLGVSSIFLEIFSRCMRQVRPRQQLSPYVTKAIAYIRQHYAEEINVNLLAEEMHISRNHLRRLFLRDLGITPKEQITRCRMDVAATLIETSSDSSLSRVASMVGYPSYSQFIQAFRHVYGCSPKEYRAEKE